MPYRQAILLMVIDCVQLMLSFDKQLFLSEMIENMSWQFDLKSGELTIGSQYVFQTQVLGTEEESSGTWLWAWANEASDIPHQLLHASRTMKAFGDRHGISELTDPEVSLDQIDGHTLALISSEICKANAYYRCPYHGGALFLLIVDQNFPKRTDQFLNRISFVFSKAIASLNISDHKAAFTGYLNYHNLAFAQSGNQVIVEENGEPVVIATFDDENRLTNLEVTLKPTVIGTSSPRDLAI